MCRLFQHYQLVQNLAFLICTKQSATWLVQHFVNRKRQTNCECKVRTKAVTKKYYNNYYNSSCVLHVHVLF